jgi:NAD+ diphosphatase
MPGDKKVLMPKKLRETRYDFEKEIITMTIFLNNSVPETAYWFLCTDRSLLIRAVSTTGAMVPQFDQATVRPWVDGRPLALGEIDGLPCLAASLKANISLPKRLKSVELRPLYVRLPEAFFGMALKAIHLLYWDRHSRFCGLCGARTADKADECAKVCQNCGELYYPRIAPAIIVAVIKDGQILLAHANRFPADLYSVIAGFVEPGESLEECVRREVREEVGLGIKNLRYFCSQPWPFPDSLMVGFIADYESGTITVDLTENQDAAWFAPDHLPTVPGNFSIARRLIDWFLAEYGRPS